jgi:hypothetical protein
MESATMLNFSKSLVSDEAELMKVGSDRPSRSGRARMKDGTPETATAALGTAPGMKEQWSPATAQEVRTKNLIKKAEEWAAARRRRIEEGGKSQGRSRG